MKLELKTNTKISYISAYIKEKFPMYHRSMTELEFGKLVNQINLDSDIKGVSFDVVKNGELDSIIDNHVNLYAQNNLKDIWENFDNLREHIIKVISENSKFKDAKEFINEISMRISLNISDEIGFDKIFTNQYNNEIFNQYLSLRNSFKVKLVKYIGSVFSSFNEKIGFDKNTTIAIFNMISEKIIENYNADNIYDVGYIREMFVEISSDITRRIIGRVRYVLNNVDIFCDIPEREVFSQIVMMATVRGEVNAIKIINGEMDNFIMNVINSKQKKTSRYDDQTVLQYVYKVLLNESDEEIIGSALSEFTVQVVDRLKSSEYEFNNSDIMEHRCDKIIKSMYLERYCLTPEIIREKMKRQSVKTSKNKTKKPVDLFKKAMLKRKIQRDLSCLLIVATLSSVGGFAIGNAINKKNDRDAMFLAKSLDTTSYSISHSSDIMEKITYNHAVEGVINYYNQLKKHGNEYANLCFYNAFSEGLSLNEMDLLFSKVRTTVGDDVNFFELSNILNKEDCFLDFIYDSLIMMGCEEIKNDKYMESLISYKQSFYGNMYGIVSDYHIYSNDKRNIDKMMELYDEYCKKNLTKLGNELQENNIYNDSDSFSEDIVSGRSM